MQARIEWLAADQGTVTMKSPVCADPAIAPPCPAPAIGQDTADILVELGVTPAELDQFASANIIRIGKPGWSSALHKIKSVTHDPSEGT
jgi:crotonobetainyl-CoA:carnitine CoA-transferase CaiB-like acyl-CoA transferase